MKKLRQQQHVKTMLCYLVVSGTLLLTRDKCVKYIIQKCAGQDRSLSASWYVFS